MNCRHCKAPVGLTLVDLGSAPPSNAYLTADQLKAPEKWFPLRVLVCESCWLVQTEDFANARELFDAEYAYFSGFSSSWLAHSERYAIAMIERFGLGAHSHVVEVAANDGYLLQYFQARGIPCLGIEPTASTAAAARAKGLRIVEDFFGVRLARDVVDEFGKAHLTAANNVLAHVPDINDFVAGFAMLLAEDGVSTFEFPHLLNLLAENQFDTIYHEHFSYLSLTAVQRIFAANGLTLFDVEEHPTHGGSLRVFAQRADTGKRAKTVAVDRMLEREKGEGIASTAPYAAFQERADRVKNDVLTFLLQARKEGKTVAGYGAAAKGNTLLNYAGARPDLIRFVVDRNPAKQGKFLPGNRIPIVNEARLRETKPDYVVILPWNLAGEVIEQLGYIRSWGGRFVTAIPQLVIA
jgi:hypothetical protein